MTLSVLATLASVAAALSVPAHADQRAVVATGLGMTAGQSVAPNGDVAVTSYTNGTVTVFRDGSQIAEYGGFLRPHDVAFDSRGVMYVAQFGRDL
ncbi:MAG: hypothetical protein EB027_06680, partial [Actinobacteria bacterium]|nr:hypothetical protein [Actinomycetota bacterium]